MIIPPIITDFAGVVLSDSPEFFYLFDRPIVETGKIPDLSPNHNDGTNLYQSNSPLQLSFQQDNRKSALFPYNNPNQARIQTPVSLSYPNVSVEVVVLSDNYGFGGENVRFMADGHTDQGNQGFELFLPNSGNSSNANYTQVQWTIGNGVTSVGCNSGNVQLLQNKFYHIVATANNSQIFLYINGVQVGVSGNNVGTLTSSNNIGVGFNPNYNGDFFCGQMYMAAAYTSCLSASRVVSHWNSFRSGKIYR